MYYMLVFISNQIQPRYLHIMANNRRFLTSPARFGETALEISLISLFLYLSLVAVCLYFARKFYIIKKTFMNQNDVTKMWFFVILTISALLDVPLFLACACLGGPEGTCNTQNVRLKEKKAENMKHTPNSPSFCYYYC